MASKKAGSSKATQKGNVIGKRLGVKKFGGEVVQPGSIIVRQRGFVFHPGKNTLSGKDHTIFSTIEGIVSFVNFSRSKKRIDVNPKN